MNILLSSRHAGAIEKSKIAFENLCENLLQFSEKDREILSLSKLPEIWMYFFFWNIIHRLEITRRSAGLPFCFTAILRAESLMINKKSNSSLKRIIPFVIQQLLYIAKYGTLEETIKNMIIKQIYSINYFTQQQKFLENINFLKIQNEDEFDKYQTQVMENINFSKSFFLGSFY